MANERPNRSDPATSAKPPALDCIRVMSFIVSISAPAETSEADLEKMMAHAHRIKEALALTAITAVPICYSPAVDVQEIS